MFPAHWGHEQRCQHALLEILENQRIILHNQARNQGEIMSALTDVQAKLAKLQADVKAFVAANSGGASDADLVAIGALIDQIEAIVAPPTPPAPIA